MNLPIQNKINPNQLEHIFLENFAEFIKEFYEMQSLFLAGLYKRYGSIETANIILCLAKNSHLQILRLRECDLDRDISLNNLFLNLQNINNISLKIVEIVNTTSIPKETARRKIKDLIKKDYVIIKQKKEYRWNLLTKHKNDYNKIISEEIVSLSKFIKKFLLHAHLDMDIKEIENEIKSKFSFYWYHFLSCQLSWLSMWQNKIKDVDLLLISIQALIPTIEYVDELSLHTRLNMDNFYTIIGKTNYKYNVSNHSISATSVSEITGIPRATCIRKLNILQKMGLLVKEENSKRYYVNQMASARAKNILTKENVNYTISTFSSFLTVIVNSLMKKKNKI